MPRTRANRTATVECGVCRRTKARKDCTPAERVAPSVARLLDAERPAWREAGWICRQDLRDFRRQAMEKMLGRERGKLTQLDRDVVESVSDGEILATNVEDSYERHLSVGDRLADRMAGFAGSWTFIILFLAVMAAWMAVNLLTVLVRPFDPYPFILLNLVLSCVAALQAPLIMMSQGRQEAKDRLRSENDYRVNLKAELEIRHLHEIIEQHLGSQWERLSELQEMQLELFDEISGSRRK